MFIPTIRRAGLVWALALAVSLAPRPARSAGFSVYEQGGRGMGFAGAFTAIADDPSAIFHNPAGIGFLKGKQIYVGATLVRPRADFVGANPYPGEGVAETGAVSLIPVPTLYYTHQFSERLVFGVGIDAPFGLKTQWANPDTFSGRYLSLEADLKSFSLNPTVAYKLADRLSIAGGVDIRFSSVTLRRRVPAVNPFTQRVVDIAEVVLKSKTNTGFGFDLGVLAKPTENLSLGASYRHRVQVDYGGTAAFEQIPTGNTQFDTLVAGSLPQGRPALATAIDFPAIGNVGAAYKWSDWTVAADVVWFQWSTFDRVDLRFADNPRLNQTLIENYENSWQARVGLERRLSPTWAVRAGYFYDQSPAPTSSISPLLPDASRNGIALGGTWQRGSLRIDAGTWYLRFKERSTEGRNREGYNGTYNSSAITFGASLGYRF